MSQENVETVHRAYDAMRRRDLPAFLALMDPEVEGTFHVLAVEGQTFRGREGMRQFAEELWSVFPDWNPKVAETREVGNAVIAEIHGTGRGVGSGVDVQITIWQVLRLRDGKCIWMHGYPTEEEALEAVGLSE